MNETIQETVICCKKCGVIDALSTNKHMKCPKCGQQMQVDNSVQMWSQQVGKKEFIHTVLYTTHCDGQD